MSEFNETTSHEGNRIDSNPIKSDSIVSRDSKSETVGDQYVMAKNQTYDESHSQQRKKSQVLSVPLIESDTKESVNFSIL